MTAFSSAAVDGERRDRALVRQLLAHLHGLRHQEWRSIDFPEARIVSREAVQVIAMEETGRTTAIEHMPVESDAEPHRQRFVEAFRALSTDPALPVDAYHIDLRLSIHVTRAPGDLAPFAAGVRAWTTRHLAGLAEGTSNHIAIVERTPIQMHVEKTRTSGEPGRLSIVPDELPARFETTLHDQLQRKLPKLVAASADRHVLLIERAEPQWSIGQLRLSLQAAVDFPDLQKLYEIWMVDTTKVEPLFRLVISNADN